MTLGGRSDDRFAGVLSMKLRVLACVAPSALLKRSRIAEKLLTRTTRETLRATSVNAQRDGKLLRSDRMRTELIVSEMEAYAKLLNAIIDETIDASRDVLQPPPPDVLYHYTTPAGVLGIIESGSIYLSDALFLNDQSELLYGRELVAEALREELAAATDALLKKSLPSKSGAYDAGRRIRS